MTAVLHGAIVMVCLAAYLAGFTAVLIKVADAGKRDAPAAAADDDPR